MADGNLTFEEFWKLPEQERGRRYQELSEHDRFRVRISMNPGVKTARCCQCQHYQGFLKCEAFPDGIPREHRIKIDCEESRICGRNFYFVSQVNQSGNDTKKE